MATSTAEFSGSGVAAAAAFGQRLRQIGRRLRLRAVVLRGARALWLAALLYVGLSFGGSVFTPQLPVFALSFFLAVGLFLALTVPVLARRRSALDVARAYDARLALSARLATAVELSDNDSANPFRGVQLEDAWRHAQEIRPRRVFPLRIPRTDALLLLVGLAALFFWEVFPYMGGQLAPLAPLAHQVAAAREGTLAEPAAPDALVVAEESQSGAAGELVEPDAEQAAQPEQLQPLLTQADSAQQQNAGQQGEAAEGEAGERAQGQANLGDLAQQGEESGNPHVNQQETTLAEIGRELAQARPSRSAGQSLEQGNYQQAAQSLEQLAQNVRDLSREDRNDMTDAFAKAAERAEAADPRLAQELADVSREVASYNDRETQRELQELGDAIEERGQRIRNQQQMEAQAEQLRAGASAEQSGAQANGAQQQDAQAQQAFNTEGVTEQGGASQRQDSWRLQSAPGGGPSQGGGDRGEESFQPGPEAPRLQIAQKPSVVLADRGIGPSRWSPQRAPVAVPGPGTAPAQYGVTDAGNAIISTGGASHFVPWTVADYVQQYFNALSNALEQAP